METILDIFTTLNCAIDAGAMTQEALAVALAATVSRTHEELERGAVPLDWKQRLTREVEGLAPHPRRAAGFSHRRPSWLDCCDVATRFGNRLGRPRTRKTRIGNSSKKKLNGQ
jgi:hypothetical protein